jgi:hypothetical protein
LPAMKTGPKRMRRLGMSEPSRHMALDAAVTGTS